MSDNNTSSLILIGVGGAGGRIAAGVARAYGSDLRMLVIDTDASSGNNSVPFTLLGGNHLAGRGSGGSIANARSATKDDLDQLVPRLQGVRTAVIVTGLGGGTGCGATLELLEYLKQNGITSLLFATEPFSFEGEERRKLALSVKTTIEDRADVSVFLPLDKLTAGAEDNMKDALQRGVDTVSTGVTLLWRLLEKPGFIELGAERLRHLLDEGGTACFATATAAGPDRVDHVIESLKNSPFVQERRDTTRAILVGILAGDDLRLSEIGKISESLTFQYGPAAEMALGTVNDEATFAGRLTAVVLAIGGAARRKQTPRSDVKHSGRFQRSERSVWNGVDLDKPTFMRQNIKLDR